ncbi:MAG: benzoylformate decarboxylase [Solirubrobacterales bacterium]|nr:benzoylformate decarboxylase [Solirubrobacterales bacterium]
MPTVREVTFDLFRKLGMTTIFGNPGSTELPMLADYPDDFDYVLGLQEAAVVGMADGHAQVTRKPTLVNLHTAPGLGNAVGALFNAQANHSPVVVTVGQQVRAQVTMQANLTNRDSIRVPDPFVKYSYEPARAEDVPLALAHAIHLASIPPMGPVMVSIPMDDWDVEMDATEAKHVIERAVAGRTGADPAAIGDLAAKLEAAKNPVLVAGPDIDSADAWDEAIALAEDQNLPVWASPATGGGRLGFPEGHPHWRGVLPPAIQPVGETLKDHDLILVVGSSVFPYYPYLPGPLLGENSSLVQITSDPDEAARAPMGSAIVSDVKLAMAALNAALDGTDRPAVEPWPGPVRMEETDPLNASVVMNTLKQVIPDEAVIVLEAPTSTMALRNQLRISKPNSYFFGAGGGLGFGLSAAVGIQYAEDRPVVCVLGEGSVQYAVTAFWTAAAYDIPVTFLVLRNEEYGILKWFAEVEQVSGSPGLDLPALETSKIAAGYGIESTVVKEPADVEAALREAIAAAKPRLVEVPVQSGMALF